jgi:hypothetical protein
MSSFWQNNTIVWSLVHIGTKFKCDKNLENAHPIYLKRYFPDFFPSVHLFAVCLVQAMLSTDAIIGDNNFIMANVAMPNI